MDAGHTDIIKIYLEPIQHFLNDASVTDIYLNTPQRIFVERAGDVKQHEIPEFTLNHLENFGQVLASRTDQVFNDEYPCLSVNFPTGERIQMMRPPVTEPGVMAFALRRFVKKRISLASLCDNGIMQCAAQSHQSADATLSCLLNEKRYGALIQSAIAAKKNILICGGTGTGKTTFLNACLQEINAQDRLVCLEDTREIDIEHENKVHLIAGKSQKSKTSMTQLLEATLRLRPDRIILGELRGEEAATFLEAVATGHDGSFATIHASSPELALEQLAIKAERGGLRQQSRAQLLDYIRSVIHVVIHLRRLQDGTRVVETIALNT